MQIKYFQLLQIVSHHLCHQKTVVIFKNGLNKQKKWIEFFNHNIYSLNWGMNDEFRATGRAVT